MKWPGDLIEATLIKRYKRFLADFKMADGQIVTAHCANTGSMKTCLQDDALCRLTFHDDPKRKLKYSWQAIQMPDGWVGINTSLANRLTSEAISNGVIKELAGYKSLATEKKYGANSRIDILLEDPSKPPCYVEVKNVTLLLKEGVAGFPDAVTQRGAKHLKELAEMVSQGNRAVLIYCVQRESVKEVAAAEAFDPEYARILKQVKNKGVEVYAYQALFTSEDLRLARPIPVHI